MSPKERLEITPEIAENLVTIVNQRIESLGTPGIFATIFQGEQVLFEVGRGVRVAEGETPDSNTIFRIASCTKSFTITALLKLRDEGKLNLDQLITDFVPEFTFSSLSTSKSIPTLRHLASMSAGLPTDDPWADRQESITPEALREIVKKGVSSTSTTGALFQYSNLGFALLGLVIERASGRDFREFVSTEILSPLGMDQTGFNAGDFQEVNLAKGYRKVDERWLELPFSKSGSFSSIGGLFSSGRDLRIWSNWLYSALDEDKKEFGPLSASSRREMQFISTPALPSSELGTLPKNSGRVSGYGLGLFVEYDQRFGQFVSHSGGYPGFSSHMRWHVPTGLSVVVLENATYSGAMASAIALLEGALEALNYQLPKPEIWPVTYEFAAKADSLIHEWSDDLAFEIFSENVGLDIPFPERRASISQLIEDIGGLKEPSGIVLKRSDSPVHLVWKVAGGQGELTCEIRLTPDIPIKIQTFSVKKA